jgi:hypothetical protein
MTPTTIAAMGTRNVWPRSNHVNPKMKAMSLRFFASEETAGAAAGSVPVSGSV